MTGIKGMERITDGILAIAIALLLLDLMVPSNTSGESLAAALWQRWPSYITFVVSFLIIGNVWIDHHGLFAVVARVNRMLLAINALLLLATVGISFLTAEFADRLIANRDSHVIAALYSSTLVIISACFVALRRWLTTHPELLLKDFGAEANRSTRLRFGGLTIAYLLTVSMSFVNSTLCLFAQLVIILPLKTRVT